MFIIIIIIVLLFRWFIEAAETQMATKIMKKVKFAYTSPLMVDLVN